MSTNSSKPHKDSGNTPESPENSTDIPTQIVNYTPRTHGVDVFVQLRDDNGLYNESADLQRQLDTKAGYHGRSDHPHHVGDMSPSWT
ncbi:hypothetical protein, partial [Halorubrum sp. SP9]